MEYAKLAELYERLEATTKRLEKTHILSEFLRQSDDIEKVMLLLQGRVFPNWDTRELGMSTKLVLKAIATATGASQERIEKEWKETGDLGKAAANLTKSKTQATLFSQSLSLAKVFDNLRKCNELEGEGTVDRKVQLAAELLTSASPSEAKYIVRTVIGELRIGLGDGTLRDALVWAFFADKTKSSYDKEKNDLVFENDSRETYESYVTLIQEALDVINDFGQVAKKAKEGEKSLKDVNVELERPLKVMLFQKAKDIKDAFEIVGKPAAFEVKYDGFRLQIHKKGKNVTLFTRRLENATNQFPDVVSAVQNSITSDACILDAEVIGIDANGKALPFQNISQRIKRKYDIAEMAQKYPVQVAIFDAVFIESSLLSVPFAERHAQLKRIVKESDKIKVADHITTDDEEIALQFYEASLAKGNEGVMAKNLQSIYKPGSRVGFGVKIKPTMDTLEVVIVGAEWGEGKRGEWLASFMVAVRDPESNTFVEIGRVGTGIKEKAEEGVSFGELTTLLTPLIIEKKNREVKVRPEIVMEVDYEEIQKSPSYSSGFALRFPRMVRLRSDRSAQDINTIDDVRELAEYQRGRGEQT